MIFNILQSPGNTPKPEIVKAEPVDTNEVHAKNEVVDITDKIEDLDDKEALQ